MCRPYPIALSIILLSCAFTTIQLSAQGVSIETLPKSQVQGVYHTSYVVKAEVTNGFNKSIFLRAYSAHVGVSNIDIIPAVLNYPYIDSCIISVTTGGARTAGTYDIIIEGSNGPMVVLDTVAITVNERPAWRTFDSHNTPLIDKDIRAIAIDSSGVAWIGTGAELARFDGTTWTLFPEMKEGNPYFNVTDIAIGPSGSVWVKCNSGLFEFRDNTWHKHDMFGVKEMVFAQDGTMWAATELGLCHYDGITKTMYDPSNSPVGYPLSNIVIDKNGIVWTYTQKGVYGFDGTYWLLFGKEGFGLKSGQWLTNLSLDADGDVWLTTGRGLAEFDGTAFKKYDASDLDTVSPGRSPDALLVDRVGTTWIAQGYVNDIPGGTYSWGLARFENGKGWHYNTGNSDLPDNTINEMVVDKNNTLWIGTRGGLALLDGNAVPIKVFNTTGVTEHIATQHLVPLITNISPNPVRSLAQIDINLFTYTHVRIAVLNTLGQELLTVCDEVLDEGANSVTLNASALSAGTYIVRIVAGDAVESKKLIISR